MIAVMAGATGLVGFSLLKKVLSDPDFTQVISVSRKKIDITDKKLEQVLIRDLSELPHKIDDLKGDIYFCCLGTTIKDAGSKPAFRKVDFDAILDFAKIAYHHRAKKFLLISASGASDKSFIFYSRVKGETENAIKNLGLMSTVIFQPSLLIGERKTFRLGEKIFVELAKAVGPVLPSGIKKNLMTDVDVLATGMLRKAKESTRRFEVVGPRQI